MQLPTKHSANSAALCMCGSIEDSSSAEGVATGAWSMYDRPRACSPSLKLLCHCHMNGTKRTNNNVYSRRCAVERDNSSLQYENVEMTISVLGKSQIASQCQVTNIQFGGYTRHSAVAGKPRDAFRGQSRSSNMVPFDMLGMVSY